MHSQIDFGYPWWLSYGHLVVTAVAVLFWLLGRRLKWGRVRMLLIGAVTLWSVAAFVAARFGLDVNGRLPLPTPEFLTAGSGRVLDMGAGTGRSTIMVLEARPQTTVVALDLFAESFKQHFGSEQSGQERLRSNLLAAGVESRATIHAGDMRKLPFDPAVFDGVVSTYAIDHLSRQSIPAALGEASRVLKPGGEFLMMVINKDAWLNFTFGPLLFHSGTASSTWWTSRLQEAGFRVVEQGTRPATLYFLARKP
jgi:ubiquinone/menaquinone biosynthesis C-methylase UbiE